jgi:hypothetical protein
MMNTFRKWVVLVGALYFFVPLLASLHGSISGDTLSVLVGLFSFLHLLFYDYQSVFHPEGGDEFKITPFSLNMAILAVLLLCSRLKNHFRIFVLLYISYIIFSYFQYLRTRLLKRSYTLYKLIAFMITSLNCVLLFSFSEVSFFFYITILGCLLLVMPFTFIYYYQFKK